MGADYGRVSVVVPVYNVRDYLAACVDSLIGQTYADLELILVDDGSTDGSGDLCDGYATLDKRVAVAHQINGGLSSARNVGMELATGDWILFVDSDDAVSPLYVESLVRAAAESGADLATCRFSLFSTGLPLGKTGASWPFIADGVTAAEEILSDGRASTSAWGKLAKSGLWRACPFPEGRKFEDLPVTWKLAIGAEKVCMSSDRLYYYRRRRGSISAVGSASEKSVQDYIHSISQMLSEASATPEAEALRVPSRFRAALECCRLWEMCSRVAHPTDAIRDAEDWAAKTGRECAPAAVCDHIAPIDQRMRIVMFAMSPSLSVRVRGLVSPTT